MSQIKINSQQVAEKSILDAYSRNTYLGVQYIVSLQSFAVTGTSEFPLVLMQNISASKYMYVVQKRLHCLTASGGALGNLYYAPTSPTSGSVLTPVNLNLGATGTSSMLITSGPTVAATGYGNFVGAMSAAAYLPDTDTILNIIQPGQAALFTATVATSLNKVTAEFVYYEF